MYLLVYISFNTTNIRELITFYTASNSSTIPNEPNEVIPNEVQVLKLFALAVAVWTWIGFYHNSWVEKSSVNDLRGRPNNSAKYFSVCAYNFPGKIGLIFGFIKHQVATIALWFGASYAIFALFDYAVSRRDWQIMQNLNVKNALGFFCFLTVASVVFHVLSHVVLPGVLASMIASNDDINGLDAVKRAIKLADRTRSHETIFIVIVLMTFFAFGASFFNIVILDPLIANLSIAQKYKDILESFLDGLTFAYYYACFSYALASIYLHINGSSARASAPVRSNPPVAAAPASSSKKSSSKSPARSRASSSSKKRTPSKSKSPKK